MARSRNGTQTAEPETAIRDAVDMIVSKLNELEGISFVRDAWENKAPDNYGVVELNGSPLSLWADGVLVEQMFQTRVHIYVTGGSDEWVAKVQTKLQDVCDDYRLESHEYAFDINKNHWTWLCNFVGPIQWDEEVVTVGTVGS